VDDRPLRRGEVGRVLHAVKQLPVALGLNSAEWTSFMICLVGLIGLVLARLLVACGGTDGHFVR